MAAEEQTIGGTQQHLQKDGVQQHLPMEGEDITPQKDGVQQHLPMEGQDITLQKDGVQQHLPMVGEDITPQKDGVQQHLPMEEQDITPQMDGVQQHLPVEGQDITPQMDAVQQHLPMVGEDVTPQKDGGVLKLVTRAGSCDELPAAGDTVWVHYVGTLLDGTPFDSSRERGEQFHFVLGEGSVIKAWELGVAAMRVGELCTLTCTAAYAYGAQGSPPKIPPDATLVFEVELFRFRGTDVTEDGLVTRRRVVTKGSGYARPGLGTAVEVSVEGSSQGRTFDRRQRIEFELGEGDTVGLPEGVEAAITAMERGEESLFAVAPEYGFGEAGNAGYGVPGGAKLVYRIRLAAFDTAKEPWEMSAAEKLEQSALVKEKGSQRFKEGKYQQALAQYKRVLRWLEYSGSGSGGEQGFSEEEGEAARARALRLAAHLNLAACGLRLGDTAAALEHCDKALELDQGSEKALFRRGEALLAVREYERARADFQKVLGLYPANGAARAQAGVCLGHIRAQREKDRRLYGRMFHKMSETEEEEEATEKPGKSVKAGEEEGKKEKEGKKSEEGKTTEGKKSEEGKKEKEGKKSEEGKKEKEGKKSEEGKKEKEGKKSEEGKKKEEVVSMELENAGGAEEVEKKSSVIQEE